MTLDIAKLAPGIGAEIRGIDLNRDQSPETIAAINRIWLEHVILLFRGQDLTPERQVHVTAGSASSGIWRGPGSTAPADTTTCRTG